MKSSFVFLKILLSSFFLIIVFKCLKANNDVDYLTSAEREWIKKNKNVVIGISPDYAPFEFVDSTGSYTGISAEYFKIIADKLGLQYTISTITSWDSVLLAFRNNEIQLLPSVFIHPMRSSYIDFSEPYMEVEFVVVCSDKEKIGNFNDLTGKRIACLKGWIIEDDLQKDFSNLNLNVFKSNEQMVAALLFKHVDAIVVDFASIAYYTQLQNLPGIKIAFNTGYKYEMAIGVGKNNPLLTSAIEKTIANLPKDTFQNVKNKWLNGVYIENRRQIKQILTVLIVVLLICILGILWIVNLRNAVKIKTRSLLQQLKINELNNQIAIANERRYRVLFENSSDAILILKKFTIADFNRAAESFLNNNGMQPLKGNCIKNVFKTSFLNAEINEEWWLHLTSYFENSEWSEIKLTNADGMVFYVEMACSKYIFNSDDSQVLFIRDISKRKEDEIKIKAYQESLEDLVREKTQDYIAINEELTATLEELQNEIVRKAKIERELVQNQEILKSFISQSDEGISMLDSDGRIIEWNKKLEGLLGLKKAEVEGQFIWDVEFLYQVPEKRTEAYYLELKERAGSYLNGLNEKRPFTLERFVVDKTGNDVYLITTVFPVVTPYGSIVGRISTDITRIKTIEIELKQYKDNLEKLVLEKTMEITRLSQQYLDLFQNTSDGIVFYSIENDRVEFMQMNQSAIRMLGINDGNDKNNGTPIIKQIQTAILENVRGNDFFKIALKINTINVVKLLEISNTPVLRNQLGKFQYAMFIRDISQKVRAEKEMEFSDKIFNVAQNLILVTDNNGVILKFNQSFQEASMLPPEKLNHAVYWDLLPSQSDKTNIQRVFQRVRDGEYPCEYECTWVLPNGESKFFLWKNTLIESEDGSAGCVLSSGIDLTERKLIEKYLSDSEEKFRSIFNSSYDGIAILDLDFSFLLVNTAILNLTAYSREELIKRNFLDYISGSDVNKLRQVLITCEQGKTALIENVFLARKDNLSLPVEITAQYTKIGGASMYLVIIRDITDRLMLEQKLMNAIIETEERERKRISGDLHDEAGPLLASMRIYLSTLNQRDQSKGTSTILEKVMGLLKETTDSIRRISNNISPLVLENYGLEAALKNEFESKTEFIKIDFESNIGNIRFDLNAELSIFRIVKELLNNTLKYANASSAYLSTKYNDNLLSISYTDNGKGFDLDTLMNSKHSGLGLLNILNRVKILNGQCEMQSKPGEGFHFFMKISMKV